MNKLIKNEFKKLFGKKIMYILFLIAIVFVIISNVLSSLDFNEILDNEEYDDMQIQYYEEELEILDYKKVEDNTMYIDIKTSLDLMKLEREYDYDSWQRNYIESGNNDIYNTIWNINQNTYGFDKDEEILKENTRHYEKIKERLNSENWREFLEERIKKIDEDLDYYKEIVDKTKDKKELDSLNLAIEEVKVERQCLQWRLDKDITYSNSFLSNTIIAYEQSAIQLLSLEKIENRTKDEEQNYKECLKNTKTSLYYIENNIDIDVRYNARDFISDFTSNYGSFVIIFSIIIAGSIVSGEFQKGTIKLLLTRPYSRTKILFAKYIVSLLAILIFIILFILAQYVIGGIVFGFEDYKIPIVEYDFSKNEVVTMSPILYGILMIVTNMPIYILLTTFAFALGTISMNSAVAIGISILGNMVSDIFIMFVENIKILKYFVTLNWDLSVYLFGGTGLAEGLTLIKSGIICTIYLLIMIVLFVVVFKKRDIKNV